MPDPADPRHVLITGCSTGIGRACALRLARDNFSVFATVRNAADAESLQQANPRLRTLIMDVAEPASIANAIAQLDEQTRAAGLYALVNNAGICVVGPVECIPLEQWRYQFEVNFFGAIAVTQAALPLIRRRGSGRIVNISSVTGEISTPLFGAYSASKFALGAMGDCLHLELRSANIHVSTIIPGTIQSEIWRKEKEGVAALAPGSPARSLYGPLIENVSRYVFGCADKAIPADSVARAVSHCLTTHSPRRKYRVGWEAQVGTRARNLLPDRLFAHLLARTLRVPDSNPRMKLNGRRKEEG